MTVNAQQVASIVRQVAALAAIVMGALTQALSGIHLSPAISAALAAVGGIVLAVEHYVGDPSTGTTPPVVVQTPPVPVVTAPVVPVAQYSPPVPPTVVANPPPPAPSNG